MLIVDRLGLEAVNFIILDQTVKGRFSNICVPHWLITISWQFSTETNPSPTPSSSSSTSPAVASNTADAVEIDRPKLVVKSDRTQSY